MGSSWGKKRIACLKRLENEFIIRFHIILDYDDFSTEKEGNCLRFFALQSVSKEALMRKINAVPGTFHSKWRTFVTFCNTPNRNGKNLKSRM